MSRPVTACAAVPAAGRRSGVVIFTGLGRPLSNGSPTVLYNLLVPNTLYGDRTTQLDIRMSKLFRMKTSRISVNFDLANLLNRNDILGVTTTYGAAWQTPTTILDPRLFKLGVQYDF